MVFYSYLYTQPLYHQDHKSIHLHRHRTLLIHSLYNRREGHIGHLHMALKLKDNISQISSRFFFQVLPLGMAYCWLLTSAPLSTGHISHILRTDESFANQMYRKLELVSQQVIKDSMSIYLTHVICSNTPTLLYVPWRHLYNLVQSIHTGCPIYQIEGNFGFFFFEK